MKTALITGASSGIGAAFARELAACQTDLILVARSQDKLQRLAEQLQEKFQIRTEIILQDLTQTGAARSLYDAIAKRMEDRFTNQQCRIWGLWRVCR